MKNLLTLIILLWLKKLKRIIKLLNLKLMIQLELLNKKIFLVGITLKIGHEKYLLLILFWKLILGLINFTLIWLRGCNLTPSSWFPLNNSATVKALILNILLETVVSNLVSLNSPVSRYWAKLRRGYFRFPGFWSIPYKRKLS